MCLTKAIPLMRVELGIRVLWRSSPCDTRGSWQVGAVQGKDGWHCWGCSWHPSGIPGVDLVSLKHRICLQAAFKSKPQVFQRAQITGFRTFRFWGHEYAVLSLLFFGEFWHKMQENLSQWSLGIILDFECWFSFILILYGSIHPGTGEFSGKNSTDFSKDMTSQTDHALPPVTASCS